LSHGLFFALVCFFAIGFGNPQYSGSFFTRANGDFPFIYAVWMVGVFGLSFLASFFIERLFAGDKRVFVSLTLSILMAVFLLVFVLIYFDKRGSLESSLLIPRVFLILAAFILLFIPIGLNFSRYKKETPLPKMEEWKRYPLEGFLFAFAECIALLLLLCVGLTPNAAGNSLAPSVPLALIGVSLVICGACLLYWVFLYKKESLMDRRVLSLRMLYVAVIELALPFIAIFVSLYLYDSESLPYQVFFYSLFLYSAVVLFALLEGSKAAYENKGA
jgi:hypothetical protein